MIRVVWIPITMEMELVHFIERGWNAELGSSFFFNVYMYLNHQPERI